MEVFRYMRFYDYKELFQFATFLKKHLIDVETNADLVPSRISYAFEKIGLVSDSRRFPRGFYVSEFGHSDFTEKVKELKSMIKGYNDGFSSESADDLKAMCEKMKEYMRINVMKIWDRHLFENKFGLKAS